MAGRKTFRTDIVVGGKTNNSLKKMSNTVCGQLAYIKKMAVGAFGLTGITMSFNTVRKQLSDCVEKAKAQNEAEVKLKNALANNIQLRKLGAKAQEQSFHALTNEASWLQKIGVIGDEVALAGMQQLATYQLSTAQIVKLSAGMNNLLVKQNGLNATQENAVDIAKLMGKALSGNAGALTRYGIQMSEAEKKTFKTATQAQRVALLTRILERNVGGVNRAMANTPEGKIQQVNNLYGDMQERIGAKLLPLYGKLADVALKILPYVENGAYAAIKAIDTFYNMTSSLVSFIKSNALPIFIALGGAMASVITFATIDTVKMAVSWYKTLGNVVMIASKEGLVAMTNWQRYMMIIKGIPAVIKAWTSSVWANVMANKALKYALAGTGVGLLVLAVSELVLHWDAVKQAVSGFWQKCVEVFGKFKNFFVSHIVDVILLALGPIGLIIKGVQSIWKYANKNNGVDTTTTGHKALGTHSFIGGETWVGEHGPERISLPRGTEILSNNKSTAASSSGSVNINCTFNFKVLGSADASTVQNAVTSVVPNIKAQIDAYLRQKQRLGYSF